MESQIVNILPVYINCNNWCNDFEEINVVMQELGQNIMLIGDVNGRVGDEQIIEEELITGIHYLESLHRRSKDEVLNKNGKSLLELFEEYGMVILNGRMAGDRNGEFTFVGNRGSSVIDVCAVSLELLSCVTDFCVVPAVLSDHLPIKTIIGSAGGESENPVGIQPLKPKMKWMPAKRDEYQRLLLEAVTSRCEWNMDLEADWCYLIEAIQTSQQTNHQPAILKSKDRKQAEWFDRECWGRRSEAFSLLQLYRKTNSEVVKMHYLEANSNYKKLCKEKKKTYWRNCIEGFKTVKDSREFWTLVRQLKKKQFVIGSTISMGDWIQHFQELLNPAVTAERVLYVEPYIEDELLDASFQMQELRKIMVRVKDGKAPGEDGVPYEFFKNAPTCFMESLLNLYNRMYSTSCVPDSFKRSIVFPIFKKGNPGDASNYRGISFGNAGAKLFTAILLDRLKAWVNRDGKLREFQAGFRESYSTVDNIFNLMAIIRMRLAVKRQKVYAFFVDYSAAFDRIDRHSLFLKLSEMRISTKMLRILQVIYSNSTARVWSQEGLSDAFETNTGVKQGCLLSPLLFALFLNDLEENMEGGVKLNDTNIRILAYADDIVLLASNKLDLKKMITALEEYCRRWNLLVNLDKSKIVIFRNGGKQGRHEKWWYKGKPIEVVNSYKYLGINLTSRLSMTLHFRERLASAKMALSLFNNLLLNNAITFEAKLKVFEAVVRSIMCYGAQVWGSRMFDLVESIQWVFIRKVFSLPTYSPKLAMLLETGLQPIFLHTLRLHFGFVKRCLKLSEDRYPKCIMEEMISKEAFMFEDWRRLEESFSISLDGIRDGSLNTDQVLTTIGEKLL